jgi:hypothetical protein
MLRTLKQYAEASQFEDQELIYDPSSPSDGPADGVKYSPFIKKAVIILHGTVEEYRALLVIREAELVLARAQLGQGKIHDWYLNNRIADLETKIGDLKNWLSESKNNIQILETSTEKKNAVKNTGNQHMLDADINKQQTSGVENPDINFDSVPDHAAVLGMSVDSAVELWCSKGSPVIHLRQGEDCSDLRKLLSWSDALPEHLQAIRAWLQEHR